MCKLFEGHIGSEKAWFDKQIKLFTSEQSREQGGGDTVTAVFVQYRHC